MILSNIEIQRALDDGRLIIDPRPQIKEGSSPYDTTAVDLQLSRFLAFPKEGSFNLDLRKGKIANFLAENSIKKEIDPDASFVLEPHKFVIGWTLENVVLPIISDQVPLAARVEGKSSLARCGLLVHFTAPTVHSDWNGPLALEMINLGPSAITLFPGMPICQLIIEEVRGIPERNPSQFHNQKPIIK
jgi:dCTP deaminase